MSSDIIFGVDKVYKCMRPKIFKLSVNLMKATQQAGSSSDARDLSV